MDHVHMSDGPTSIRAGARTSPASRIFVLADRVSEGQLSTFLTEMREQGFSSERMSKELFRRWDVDVSANTVNGWLKALAS